MSRRRCRRVCTHPFATQVQGGNSIFREESQVAARSTLRLVSDVLVQRYKDIVRQGVLHLWSAQNGVHTVISPGMNLSLIFKPSFGVCLSTPEGFGGHSRSTSAMKAFRCGACICSTEASQPLPSLRPASSCRIAV